MIATGRSDMRAYYVFLAGRALHDGAGTTGAHCCRSGFIVLIDCNQVSVPVILFDAICVLGPPEALDRLYPAGVDFACTTAVAYRRDRNPGRPACVCHRSIASDKGFPVFRVLVYSFSVIDKAEGSGVQAVFTVRTPLEISWLIVCLVPVYVIYAALAVRRSTEKRPRDRNMHPHVLWHPLYRIRAEHAVQVAEPVFLQRPYPTGFCAAACNCTTYAATVADFIASIEERYWFPSFFHNKDMIPFR